MCNTQHWGSDQASLIRRPFETYFFLVSWGEVRLGSVATSTTNCPIVPTQEGRLWVWAVSGMIGRGNRSTRSIPVPVPLYPPHVLPHHIIWDRTRVFVVGRRRLTAWSTARPSESKPQLIQEWRRVRACEKTSHDSLPYRSPYDWSSSVCSCLYIVS
jgi:hypothetical protein